MTTTIELNQNNFNKIELITDDSGNYFDFLYDATTEMLDGIILYTVDESMQSHAIQKVTYEYSALDPDVFTDATLYSDFEQNGFSVTGDEVAQYGYDGTGRLNSVQTVNKELCEYTFTTKHKVASIDVFFDEALFSTLDYVYSYHKTKITDQDGNFVIHKFDNYGHTINSTDSLGITMQYAYLNLFKTYDPNDDSEIVQYLDGTPNYQNNHKLIASSVPQTTYSNPIANPGFEFDLALAYDLWTYFQISGTTSVARSSVSAYAGTYSLELNNGAGATGYMYQSVVLDKGSYTLCVSVMNTNTSQTDGVYLDIVGATMSSATSFIEADDEYLTTMLYFVVSSDDTSIQINLHNDGQGGSAFFDNVQISQGFVNEDEHLLENASFEYVNGSTTPGWNTFSTGVSRTVMTFDDAIYGELLGTYGLRIIGSASSLLYASRTEYLIDGPAQADTALTVGTWSYSSGIPITHMSDDTYNRVFQMKILTYTGTTLVNTFVIPIDSSISGWQYAFGTATIATGVDRYVIRLEYQGEGTVYFDGVDAKYETAFSNNDYDTFGRSIKQISAYGEIVEYMYPVESPDSWIPNSIIKNGTEIVEIQSEWDRIDAITTNNITTSIEYNENNQPTNVIIGETSYGSTTYVASAYEQYIESETDVFANQTSYYYDTLTGFLKAIENAKGQDTHYVYDDFGRLVRVESKADYSDVLEDPDACVLYGYDNLDRLTQIIMGCEESGSYYYEITYDDAGRELAVRVVTASSSYNLVSYVYDDDGDYHYQQQSSLTYGNDDYIVFEYDDETKAVTETNIYDEFDVLQTTFSYQYDDSGLVTVYSMYDGLGTLIDQEFYLYNASGLLQQSIDIDGNITDYGYSNGVLSSITFTFDGQSTTTAFTYDDLNILQSTTYTSMQTLVGTLS
ncbi:MAG: hypothetical protein WCX25_06635, partial [Candidatus Izemoplasmatales bacterium]